MNRWMPFEWTAAIRFLKEGRMQTTFITSGIAIGVAVIVLMSAMLAGLEANFIKRVLTAQPQIQILTPDEIARPLRGGGGEVEEATIQHPTQQMLSIDQWAKIRDQVHAITGVRHVSPTVSGSALAVRGNASRAITVIGIDPAVYFEIIRLPDYIIAGAARVASDDVVVGTELAENLGAGVGDKLNVQVAGSASLCSHHHRRR
jgi:lipoprotein-releasing system permease protein